jgi:hypothetical protein
MNCFKTHSLWSLLICYSQCSSSSNAVVVVVVPVVVIHNFGRCIKKNPWPESASEVYRPSDRRFPAKLVPTFTDRRCHVVSVTDPCDRILGFLDRIYMCIYIYI